jgi:hypothetical protein
MSPVSVQNKIAAAAERRAALVDKEKENSSTRKENWEDKLETRLIEVQLAEKFPQRQIEWLVVIQLLKRFQYMAKVVTEVREYRQSDVKR